MAAKNTDFEPRINAKGREFYSLKKDQKNTDFF